MKVFGIGLSRTGTTSLTSALNLLGIKSIHGPNDLITQNQFRNNDFKLKILNEYDSITDIPSAIYYRELDCLYPNSKFILTIRSEELWIASMRWHYARSELTEWKKFIRMKTYGITKFDPDILITVYRNHNQNVLNYFGERLLTFNVTNGWGKLCEYLNKPIPNKVFPHDNAAPMRII